MSDMRYVGHVVHPESGGKITMRGAIESFGTLDAGDLSFPIILVVGTSMSAGKTSAAAKVIRQLRLRGYDVTGAKLTGAGRQRDILAFRDAGAQRAYSFVDVGLPSTVVPTPEYREILAELLFLIERDTPDVAVVEIGSSPLEPYNGAAAINAIQANVKATILCASDPYAVSGAIHAFGQVPTFVTGIATSTIAGIELIESLTGATALNLFDPQALPTMWRLVSAALQS